VPASRRRDDLLLHLAETLAHWRSP
jgi:hypothetical protein